MPIMTNFCLDWDLNPESLAFYYKHVRHSGCKYQTNLSLIVLPFSIHSALGSNDHPIKPKPKPTLIHWLLSSICCHRLQANYLLLFYDLIPYLFSQLLGINNNWYIMKYNSVFIASFHCTTVAIWLVNMWMGVEKSFCVLEYARINSIILVQRHFHACFHKKSPTDNTTKQWYETFENTGYLCVPKRPRWPGPSEEIVNWVCEIFQHSPRKSTRRTSQKLGMSRKQCDVSCENDSTLSWTVCN
jgi:hypothetical protein